jgi:glutamate decarboxylase
VVALTAEPSIKLRQLAMHLADRGWAVPVYTLPPDLADVEVMRIVVRSDLTQEAVDEVATAVEEFVATAN